MSNDVVMSTEDLKAIADRICKACPEMNKRQVLNLIASELAGGKNSDFGLLTGHEGPFVSKRSSQMLQVLFDQFEFRLAGPERIGMSFDLYDWRNQGRELGAIESIRVDMEFSPVAVFSTFLGPEDTMKTARGITYQLEDEAVKANGHAEHGEWVVQFNENRSWNCSAV